MRKRGKAVGIFVFLFKNNLKTSVSIFLAYYYYHNHYYNFTFFNLKNWCSGVIIDSSFKNVFTIGLQIHGEFLLYVLVSLLKCLRQKLGFLWIL